MTAVVAESVSNRRFTMALVGTFAVLAFALSLVGLYAVVSHSVAERTHRDGRPPGARAPARAALLRLVLSEGLALAGIGVVLGLLAAFADDAVHGDDAVRRRPARRADLRASCRCCCSRRGRLGCLVPARRAMRVDPIVALRAE